MYEIAAFLIVIIGGVGGLFLHKVKIANNALPSQVFFVTIVSIFFGCIIIGIQRSAVKSVQDKNVIEQKTAVTTTGKLAGAEVTDEQLLQDAAKASEYAYAPYSKIKVGAAVLTKSNKIYTAANVENASYGLTICAERAGLCKSISEGDTAIKAIAIYSTLKNITPCGACRQFIAEFGKDIKVIFKYDEEIKNQPVDKLLPYTFHIH